MPEELGPVLDRVKNLSRSGLTSLMVLGDFLKRRVAPLQQRTRMACMYTGTNDCCRIARGHGTDFSRAELETVFRAMTDEAFSLESLVLPSGIKALCEDQALRLTVLASMPILDEGGLVVRQLRGDPNRGIHIPGASPVRQQRATQGPGGPSPRGPAPAGKGKEKVPVPEHRHKDNMEGSKARRLQRGDGSFVGEPVPKRQKTVEAERQSRAPPPPPQRQQPDRRSEEARRPSPERQIPPPPPMTRRPVTPPPPTELRPQTPPPPPEAPAAGGHHQRSGGPLQEKRSPQSSGAVGSGMTSCK
jgi:hypothetical protein